MAQTIQEFIYNNFTRKSKLGRKICFKKCINKWFESNYSMHVKDYISELTREKNGTTFTLTVNCSYVMRTYETHPTCEFCGNYVTYDITKPVTLTCGAIICRTKSRAKISSGRKQSSTTKHRRYMGRINNGNPWHTEATKQKIRETNQKTHSTAECRAKMKESYERNNTRQKLSNIMKTKILNGEFTPCVTNSWANSRTKIVINGFDRAYRSSWDAAFQLLNPKCEYETLRIKYEIDGNFRIYIVDFVCHDTKTIYEIKPKCNQDTKMNILKQKAAIQWCADNGYTYTNIDNEYFKTNAKFINFDSCDIKITRGMKQFI